MTLKSRVDRLEQILVGIKNDSTNPVEDNRLEGVIVFAKEIAIEVGKMQELLENLLQELKDRSILSGSRIEELKIVSGITFEIHYFKSKLADIIRQENELESVGKIPKEVKELLDNNKKAIIAKIESLEDDLRTANARGTDNSEVRSS